MDGLTELLGADKVVFREQNAGGGADELHNDHERVPRRGRGPHPGQRPWPLQAAASATADTPILGTSVTDYAVALGLDEFDGTVGGNISGTSDLVDLEAQAAIISELFRTRRPSACSTAPASPTASIR